jgi:Ion channel
MNESAEFQIAGRPLRRFSAVELLVSIVLLIFVYPFLEAIKAGSLIESILFTFVLVSAVVAISGRGRTLAIALSLALPTLASRWMHDYRPDLIPMELFLVGAIIFVFFVIGNLLRFVLTAEVVDTEVLCASMSAYLLLGLLWALAYWLVAEVNPGAFVFNTSSRIDASIEGFNGLYFSFITLSTVGYGDITPVSHVARMLAAMEALTGLLYVAVLIARLVALHSGQKSNAS